MLYLKMASSLLIPYAFLKNEPFVYFPASTALYPIVQLLVFVLLVFMSHYCFPEQPSPSLMDFIVGSYLQDSAKFFPLLI